MNFIASHTNLAGAPQASTIAREVRIGVDPLDTGLDSCAMKQTFKRGEVIFHEGDPASAHFKVVTGAVRIFNILADGRRHVIDFMLEGQTFGFTIYSAHGFCAEAITDCVVSRFERSAIDRLTRELPSLNLCIVAMASRSLDLAQRRMVTLGCKRAPEKLASFLLMMADQGAMLGREETSVALPMPRNDIADYLGLTIETVSRLFTRFRKDGLLELTDSRHFRIVDWETLEDLAEGNIEGGF
jgi:CRP/FNR family transcriptional regulator